MATNYAIGGWYNNPEQGNKNMRYWGPGNWTTDPNYDPSRSVSQPATSMASSGFQSSSSNPLSSVADFAQAYRKANEPAIQNLQSQIPEVQQYTEKERARLEAKKLPLKERYDALIAEVTQGETREAGREFAKRGIPVSSGLVGQTVNERLTPQIKSIGLAGEEAIQGVDEMIAGLSSTELDNLQRIRTAIANLQSGGESSAITSAYDWYKQQKAEELAKQESDWQKKVYEETTLPESKTRIANAGSDASGIDKLTEFLLNGGGGNTISNPEGQRYQQSIGSEPPMSPAREGLEMEWPAGSGWVWKSKKVGNQIVWD